MLSDNAVNLANINTDIIDLISRLETAVAGSENLLETLAGPVLKKDNNPDLKNSTPASMLAVLYANVKRLEALIYRVTDNNSELDNVLNGSPTAVVLDSSRTAGIVNSPVKQVSLSPDKS